MSNKVLGRLMWIIGFIMYVIFLVLISHEFGDIARVYSIMSSLGVLLFTFGIILNGGK